MILLLQSCMLWTIEDYFPLNFGSCYQIVGKKEFYELRLKCCCSFWLQIGDFVGYPVVVAVEMTGRGVVHEQ